MRPILSFARHANFFVASSIGALYLYFEETRPEKLKLKTELKINGNPVPVPPKISNIVDEVKNDMELKKEQKYLIKPFLIQSLDLKHFGFFNGKMNSFLGIPHYFIYENKNDTNFLTMVEEKIIPKFSSEIEALLYAMCLSEKAKKFGIAHELYEILNSQVQLIAGLPVFTVTSCNIISYLIEKFSKHKGGSPYRIHVLIFSLGVTLYFLALNLVIAYKETESDFLASELGKSYIQGGIEYYDKMIKRNKILKKLNVNAPYTEDGDVRKPMLRAFHVPLSRKITYLEDLGSAKKKKPSVWMYILHFY